ncbi:MAG: outer membrane protein assembly factor BamD [Candidatus Aureabacteria bacterium]|nr:outer membrane protein assembly factor BamD [Candidatus Auribacterota bacterium]
MMKRYCYKIIFVLALASVSTFAPAPWVWTPESGKFVNPKWEPKKTAKLQMEYARSFEEKKEYKEAADEYKKVAKFFPGSAFAPEGQMAMGRMYEKAGKYYEAFLAYKSVLEKYPSYGHVDEIIDNIYRIGNDFLAGRRRYLWKFKVLTATDKAAEIFEFLVEQAPFSKLAPEAQFRAGLAYQKIGDYNKAVEAYGKVLEIYSDAEFADDAKFQIGLCWYDKSKGPEYDQEATDNAIKELYQFRKQYPRSDLMGKADELITELEERKAEELYRNGVFYEKQGNYISSKVYYELLLNQYPDSKWSKKAAKVLSSARFKQVEGKQEPVAKRVEKENRLMGGVPDDRERSMSMPLDEAVDMVTEPVGGAVETVTKPVKEVLTPDEKGDKGKQGGSPAPAVSEDVEEVEIEEFSD